MRISVESGAKDVTVEVAVGAARVSEVAIIDDCVGGVGREDEDAESSSALDLVVSALPFAARVAGVVPVGVDAVVTVD